MQEELTEGLGDRRGVLGRLPHHRIAAQQRRHEVPGGHGGREVARGDHRGDADGHAEGEQLLVGHLRRHGLAVEPPALAEEEVRGVDDLLHLAQRLGVGLADLTRDQPRQRLLVLLHEAPELLDRPPAHGRGHLRPLALGAARGLAGGHERARVAQRHRGDLLAGGRVRGREGAAGGIGNRRTGDDRGDRVGHGRNLASARGSRLVAPVGRLIDRASSVHSVHRRRRR